jgi:hypothetical protein
LETALEQFQQTHAPGSASRGSSWRSR